MTKILEPIPACKVLLHHDCCCLEEKREVLRHLPRFELCLVGPELAGAATRPSCRCRGGRGRGRGRGGPPTLVEVTISDGVVVTVIVEHLDVVTTRLPVVKQLGAQAPHLLSLFSSIVFQISPLL